MGLYLSAARIEGDPDPLVPCLLQWVNRHDAPFAPADKKSAAMLAQLVSRAAQQQPRFFVIERRATRPFSTRRQQLVLAWS